MGNPDQLYAAAICALAGGEYRRAMSLCTQVLQVAPQHPGAASLLHRAETGLAERQDAAAPQAAGWHSAVDSDAGRFLTPLERAERARLERQGQIDGWYTAGKAALARQDWATAATLLRHVVDAPPRYRRDAALLLAEAQQHLTRAEVHPAP